MLEEMMVSSIVTDLLMKFSNGSGQERFCVAIAVFGKGCVECADPGKSLAESQGANAGEL